MVCVLSPAGVNPNGLIDRSFIPLFGEWLCIYIEVKKRWPINRGDSMLEEVLMGT